MTSLEIYKEARFIFKGGGAGSDESDSATRLFSSGFSRAFK